MVEGAFTTMAKKRKEQKHAKRNRQMDGEDGRVLIIFDRHYPEGCNRRQFIELLIKLDPSVEPAAEDAVDAPRGARSVPEAYV